LRIAWFFGSTLLSWGGGIAAAVLVGALLNAFGYYSPFHSYPTLLLVIFGLPSILTQILVLSFVLRGNEESTFLAGKLTLALVTLIVTFITRAVFMLMIILLFGMLAWYLSKLLFKGKKPF
jgi:hypothetical protein